MLRYFYFSQQFSFTLQLRARLFAKGIYKSVRQQHHLKPAQPKIAKAVIMQHPQQKWPDVLFL